MLVASQGAPVNRALSRERSDAARAEARVAYEELIDWLAGSPHLQGWRDYLASRELEQQLRRADAADPAVVSRVLSQYSSGAAGLDHRQFVAVRLALRSWLAALSPQPDAPPRETASAANPSAVHRNAPLSVLLASAHGTRPGLTESPFPTPDGPPAQQQASWPFDRMLRETSACAMLRRRFLAGIGSPLVVSPMLVRVPRASVAARPTGQNVASGIPWHDDYVAACREARRRQALLFIAFYDPDRPDLEAAGNEELVRLTAGTRGYRYVWARFPLDYRTFDDSGEICLLHHPAFADLRGRPGIAMIDYENPAAKHYRHVVSLFPLRSGRPYSFRELAAMLDLPPGTLTQRTLIYAVRTHPDAPRSAGGLPHHEMLSESQSHSTYQASITVQGHHDWESRFQRINANLGDLLSREVVAESWPGESLLDAAIECVHCWRQSEGHWDAVSSPHAEYGYDMQLGSNGVWYATGLFGD